jgi:hypothetical protein
MSEDPWADRREFPREYRHSHLTVIGREGADDVRASLMNISEGGLRFIASSPFDVGESIRVTINDRERTAKVLECSPRFQGYAVRAQYQDT